jgi:hypothetical protein
MLVIAGNGLCPTLCESVLAEFPRTRVLSLSCEGSPGYAFNVAATTVDCEFIILAGYPAVPQVGWLNALAGYAQQHPRAAIVGSKRIAVNKTVRHAGIVVSPDRQPRYLYLGLPADLPAANKSRPFQIVDTNYALIRQNAFEQAKGFDTSIGECYEGIDLCLRLREQGREVHFCHESLFYDAGSALRRDIVNSRLDHELFHDRWTQRLQPDEIQYYVEDGFFRIDYPEGYPQRWIVSPQLVSLDPGGKQAPSEQDINSSHHCLERLTRAVLALTHQHRVRERRHVSRARTLLHRVEAMLKQSHPAGLGSSHTPPRTQSGHYLRNERAPSVESKPKAGETREQRDKRLWYQGLITRIREIAEAVAPAGAIVLVASKGDPELLKLGARKCWHFLRDEQGTYAGHHPADSSEAITNLELLRSRGAAYLLLPSTAYWWLDYYAQFREHLDGRYSRLWSDEHCIVFQLTTKA